MAVNGEKHGAAQQCHGSKSLVIRVLRSYRGLAVSLLVFLWAILSSLGPDDSSVLLHKNDASSSASASLSLGKETPQQAPAKINDSNLLSALSQCNRTNRKCYVYRMSRSGLTSQLLNIFANKVYMKEVHHRPVFLVDETNYHGMYMREFANQSTPQFVLEGYFSVSFLTLTNQQRDFPVLLPFLGQISTNASLTGSQAEESLQVQLNQPELPLWIGTTRTFHRHIRKHFYDAAQHSYDRLYEALIQEICGEGVFQINDQTRKEIADLRVAQGLPPTYQSTRAKPVRSVSFHVRRTDKISQHESRLFQTVEYVDKLTQILSPTQRSSANDTVDHFEDQSAWNTSIERCFLATDDDTVIEEMERTLRRAGFTCHLDYIRAQENQGDLRHRYKASGALLFLTELSALVETTYFVGTFNSNVAGLVSILRACPSQGHEKEHYAQSYGVDSEKWILM